MTLSEVMTELKDLGHEDTRKIYLNQGGTGEYFGVKVADLKTIAKKTKLDHELADELMMTNNGDAQYLAGLMADPKLVTVEELHAWAKNATGYWISEFAIPGIAADSTHGWDIGLEWIESADDKVSSAGWATLANVTTVKPDDELDIEKIKSLLERVGKELGNSPNRTRYAMNGFVISVGSCVVGLLDEAQNVAAALGKVEVDMGETACKVPLATEKIEKILDSKRYGKKRKKARC